MKHFKTIEFVEYSKIHEELCFFEDCYFSLDDVIEKMRHRIIASMEDAINYDAEMIAGLCRGWEVHIGNKSNGKENTLTKIQVLTWDSLQKAIDYVISDFNKNKNYFYKHWKNKIDNMSGVMVEKNNDGRFYKYVDECDFGDELNRMIFCRVMKRLSTF